jgi:hypothetical protein
MTDPTGFRVAMTNRLPALKGPPKILFGFVAPAPVICPALEHALLKTRLRKRKREERRYNAGEAGKRR